MNLNVQEIKKNSTKTKLNDTLFEVLSAVLNELHDLNYSERFWRIVLQDHVRAAKSRKELIDSEESFRRPDLYPINDYGYPDFKKKAKYYLIEFVKHVQSQFKRKKITELLKKYDRLKFGFPDISAVEKDNLGITLPQYFHLFNLKIGEREKREKVYQISEKYDDIFLKNCIKELPKITVEYFMDAHDSIELFTPASKEFHIHIGRSIFMRMLVAKYAEHGARIIWYQHGSELGEFKMSSGHYLQLSYSDEFRTWGWKIEDNEVPWKAYRLDLFREIYEKHNSQDRKYDLLLCYPALSKKNRERYITITNTILDGLGPKYNKILARPRRTNKIHSHASQLSFINDERVEKSTGLKFITKEISECKIVIQMNVPSTNFLECLYIDKPTVGILKNSNPTEIVKPYYDFFLENGVLHKNFESLVVHLNNIDIDHWWEELKKEAMYHSFKNTFARNAAGTD